MVLFATLRVIKNTLFPSEIDIFFVIDSFYFQIQFSILNLL